MQEPVPPVVLPFVGRDVPHVVIEVNQQCNVRCAACYKSKATYRKPVLQIEAEIDLALRARALSVITFAGGEPTLHPDLPRVLRYASQAGVKTQLLSNGAALSAVQLETYRAAGLTEVFVHIDSRQERPDLRRRATPSERNALRASLAQRIREAGLIASSTITAYRSTLEEVAEAAQFVLGDPNTTRLLCTAYTDFEAIAARYSPSEVLGARYERSAPPSPRDGSDSAAEVVSLAEIAALLDARFGLRPFASVGSSHDPHDERWHFYYAFQLHRPGSPVDFLPLHPRFGDVALKAYAASKRLGRPYSFGNILRGPGAVAACAAAAVASREAAALQRTLGFLARAALPGSTLLHKSFTFQQGPTLAPDGTIDYCRDCPDATVRDGKLVPVCLADLLAPLPAS